METLSALIGFIAATVLRGIFFSFKAYVMLPAIILAVALVIRMRVGSALLSSLKLGVGFAGIFISFGFFVQQIAPAVASMVHTRGLDFPVLDVGWPPLAAITWASPVALVTIVMVLALNLTRTINIDIWNYWHFALVGALVQAVSGSLLLGLGATALIAVYSILAADWSAPHVQRECGLKGISITTLSINGMLPYAVAANRLFDAVPGVRRIGAKPRRGAGTDDGTRRFGILMEPMAFGALVGVLFGVLASYDVKRVLELAINVAAVMFILPHCGGLIGIPIVAAYLLIATRLAPLYTTLSANAGAVTAQSYAGDITAFTDGGNPVRFWFLSLFRADPAALAAIPVVGALVYYSWRRNRKEIEE